MSLSNFLVHIYESLVYPDRWKVGKVDVELQDRDNMTFENPDYWGWRKHEAIVIPEDGDEQIHIPSHNIVLARVKFGDEL